LHLLGVVVAAFKLRFFLTTDTDTERRNGMGAGRIQGFISVLSVVKRLVSIFTTEDRRIRRGTYSIWKSGTQEKRWECNS